MDTATSICTSIWMEISTTLKTYPVQRGALYRLLESRAVEYREIKSVSGKRGRKLVNVVSLRGYLERKGQIAATPPIKTWLADAWLSPHFVEIIQNLCRDLAKSWHLHFDLPKAGREPIVYSPEDLLARRPTYQFFEALYAKCRIMFERSVHGRLRGILDDVSAKTNRTVAEFKAFPTESDTPRLYCACLTRVLYHETLTEKMVLDLARKLRPDVPPLQEKSFAEMDELAVIPEQDDALLSMAELLNHPDVTAAERLLLKTYFVGYTFEEIADNSQSFGFPVDYPTSVAGVRRHMNRLIKKLREIHLDGF